MAAKVSISVAEPELLAWAKQRASREGMSLSAVFTEAVRRERQQEARERVLAWLGPAATLTPEREADLLAEWSEPPKVVRKAAGQRKR